ncbi:sigma-70 family RNA polymerase sigma factor [bacterium]|nr:sigma-70 family RNA polymerase sigma factor [Planctomicrobium sp.]MDA7503520.1 sigma-70 family RNA polymerase sigma factor [bacterium]MDA7527940.1 sigma-70 family RNA polymerase sigma factor [bacterium]
MSESEDQDRIHELLALVRQGDEAARNELLEGCRNYVKLMARSQVETWMNAKVDASDLVQQTLLEAYQGLASFEGNSEAEWYAWIKQILAHNTQDFIRQFRTAKRDAKKEVRLNSQRSADSVPQMDLSAQLQTPSQLMIQDEREFELANAIAQLNDDYQEVIQLRNLQRLPFDEVAERMGRSRGAVQMLWARALKQLQEILSQSSNDSRFQPPE